jgi:long-chain acyl-CoA synthetase
MEANRPWQRHYDFDVPTTLRYPRVPAQQMMLAAASAYPDKAALDFYGTRTTFWELRLKICRFANALGRLGVRQGERVGLHLPTSPAYVIAYHAVLGLGAVVVNINPMYTAEELKGVFAATGIRALISFDLVLPNVRPALKEAPVPVVVVARITDFIDGFPRSTAADLELEEGWRHFLELIEETNDTRIPRVDIAPADPALIQFTGGTTGTPKGAVLTHANVVAATLQISLWGGYTTRLTPPERRSVLSVLPYFHVYGTIVAMSWALYNCATQVLVPRFELEEFMGILAGCREITFFPTVPTLINAVIHHPKAAGLDLARKIALLNSGAAPMPLELIEQVKELGIGYTEGWGMSETTSLGISNPVSGMRKAGSIGIPWPDTDVRLVDVEEGRQEVPRGEPGEIVIRSPLVMKGYWGEPGETAAQIRDGWLHTGDIAVRDEDDYFYIVDRKKDMIIAGGFNIYPREIEEVLYRHPKIRDAVAIGVADPYRGETVKVFIVPQPGAALGEAEVQEFCRERLAAYKRPRIVEFRQELPKSPVGKILRKVLRVEEKARSESGRTSSGG